MNKTAEMRQRADACRVMAVRAVSDEHRAQLEAMATTWDGLVQQRIKLIECRALCTAA
jgi:hypothetical protein